jgi:hypothetical protein
MRILTQVRADRRIAVLMIIFLVALIVLFKPWIHGFDGMGYYSWLRSIAIDGDLDLANEFEHFGFRDAIVRTETGHTAIQYTIGVSVLWTPFFLTVHLPSLVLEAVLPGVAADGYGPQYAIAICLGSAVYAFVGLLLAYGAARHISGPEAALLSTITVWLGSGTVFYMFLHPSMSHANDIFVNSLVIAIWFWTRNERTRWGWSALGASIGLATLVRQQNATLVLFPAVEWLVGFLRTSGRQRWQILVNGVIFALSGLLVFLPQILVCNCVFGQPIMLNPHLENSNLTINLLKPQLFRALFSSDRSLFFFTPVFLVAILGLLLLRHRSPRTATMLFVSWALQIYLTTSASSGGAGTASFSRRVLLNGVPIYVIGLAATTRWMLDRGISRLKLWAAGTVLIAWNVLLIAQYITGLLPHGVTSMSAWSITKNQGRVILVVLEQLDSLLAQRFSLWR